MSGETKETMIIITLLVIGYAVVTSINKAAVTAGQSGAQQLEQGVSNAAGTAIAFAESFIETVL